MKPVLDVAIVGAGMAGLACAARLRALGVEHFEVFDQGVAVGASWRRHYDRLSLNSPFHDLPDDGGIRERWGTFFRRDELLAYLEAYVEHHQLARWLTFGVRVEDVRRNARWELRTTKGVHEARYLVMATAINRHPRLPQIPNAEVFGGRSLHSCEYKNADPFRHQRVLVIGSGNSAADIALDLVEGHARSVALWVRGPRHVISRDDFGRGAARARRMRIAFTTESLVKGHSYTRVHPEWRQRLAEQDSFLQSYAIDLSDYGIRRPEVGPGTLIHTHSREPWYDSGTAREIRSGRIEVIDGNVDPIESFTKGGVRSSTGERTFDTVIFGTGFVPNLEAFFGNETDLLAWDDARRCRMPSTDGRCRSNAEPSLFFPAFDDTPNGGMSLGLWGFEAADTIGRELKEHGIQLNGISLAMEGGTA